MSDPSHPEVPQESLERTSSDDLQDQLRLNLSRLLQTPLDLPRDAYNYLGRSDRPFTPPPARCTRLLTPVRSAATPPPVRSSRMAGTLAAPTAVPATVAPVPSTSSPRPPVPSPLPIQASTTSSPECASPSPPPVCGFSSAAAPAAVKAVPTSPLARGSSAAPPPVLLQSACFPGTSGTASTLPVASQPPACVISSPSPIRGMFPTPPSTCTACLVLNTVSGPWSAPLPHRYHPQCSFPSAFTFPPSRAFSFPPCAGEATCPSGTQVRGLAFAGPQMARDMYQYLSGVSQYGGPCSDVRCTCCMCSSLSGSLERLGACGGNVDAPNSLHSFASELSRSPDGRPKTSSPVHGQSSRPGEEEGRVHFDPNTNYATHPSARAYNVADHQSAAYGSYRPTSQPQAHSLKGGNQAGYATVPPMTPSFHGWTQNSSQTPSVGQPDPNTASSRGNQCQEERGRERSHSNPHCPEHGSSACSHQHTWESDSNGTPSTECGQCQGRHGNMPCLMCLPPVRDFLLNRFLEEAISLRALLNAAPVPSPFQLPSLASYFTPGPVFPFFTLPTSSLAPLCPVPSHPPLMFPPPPRGGPVMYNPFGRFLANILVQGSSNNHTSGHPQQQQQRQTLGQKMNTFNILTAKFRGATTGEDSWKALVDLVKFQARCLHERRGGQGGCAALQSSHLQEAGQESNSLPFVPMQLGLSEDVTEDFMLFCLMERIAMSPPLP